MSTEVVIRPAGAADLVLATHWLAAEGLPTEDLTASHMDKFIIAVRADRAVGMIGLETFGNLGLLRSLVVDQSSRGDGLGPALVAALERKARATALQELWLLTIGADSFFARVGYARKERADAPAAIQTTPEFASLCPGDAVLMCKRLG
jgi:amino-acid N-acetyltransferase